MGVEIHGKRLTTHDVGENVIPGQGTEVGSSLLEDRIRAGEFGIICTCIMIFFDCSNVQNVA